MKKECVQNKSREMNEQGQRYIPAAARGVGPVSPGFWGAGEQDRCGAPHELGESRSAPPCVGVGVHAS